MIRVAIYLLFSILLLSGNRQLSAQQSAVDADSLRREIIAILDDNELSRVERARSLRDRIAKEEAAAAAIVAADWVMQLGSPSFSKRSDAEKQLIESGGASVGTLERGAKDDDLERATRCLEILVI